MSSNFPNTSVNNPSTSSPWEDGDTWNDPNSGLSYIWYNPVWKTGGTGSGGGGASVVVGDIEPPSPAEGDLWWKTPNNVMYIYYVDATSEQWVIASPPAKIVTNPLAAESGEFSGNLLVGDYQPFSFTPTNEGNALFADGTMNIVCYNGGNPRNVFEVYDTTGTDNSPATVPTIALSNTGSASFSGNVVAGSSAIAGGAHTFYLNSNTLPALYVRNYGTAQGILIEAQSASNAFQIRDNSNNSAIALYGNGNASFAGNVTAPNVTFALEADDDTKYTSTTDVDGNVTLVYNGETLDVKDRLQKAGNALQTLKTAAASATDFASLQTAIATALADI